ncbi:salivary glue protein Sgs-3-like [Sabethes cyaneus]|uniref:salivary glue protein Sgs-3-like n=1 Tax=Sabethes cyaneus TaxID=53552 RepID=UPI00237DC4E1|nr:salivary glue protein Sgs-3-like [Sabethes cyaneus]
MVNLPPATSHDTGSLLRRCPCVPINTCYSQGDNLNEQQYLNANFQCPRFTYQHCCGPYYPTLGSEQVYSNQPQLKTATGEPPKPREAEKVMVIVAQSVGPVEETSQEEPVMTVLPETTTALQDTTTDFLTTDTEDETTTLEATTLEPTTTTSTTTRAPRGRLGRFHNRRPIPRYQRGSTTVPSWDGSSTTEHSSVSRLPNWRGLYQRRRKEEPTSSTSTTTTTTTESADHVGAFTTLSS